MLFALDAMSPDATAIFYLAAVLVAALAALAFSRMPRVQLGWAALALFVIPFAWNAVAQAQW